MLSFEVQLIEKTESYSVSLHEAEPLLLMRVQRSNVGRDTGMPRSVSDCAVRSGRGAPVDLVVDSAVESDTAQESADRREELITISLPTAIGKIQGLRRTNCRFSFEKEMTSPTRLNVPRQRLTETEPRLSYRPSQSNELGENLLFT
jgi:hypothetical protein